MANPSSWRDRRRSPVSGGSWSDDDPPNEGRQERPEASSLLHRSALDIQGEHRRPYSPVAETVSSHINISIAMRYLTQFILSALS